MRPSRPLGVLLLLSIGACGSPRSNLGPIDAAIATSDTAPASDVSTSLSDVGIVPTDAGTEPTDAGTEPTDAGIVPTDVGTAPTDVGTAPTDVGTAPDVPATRCGDGTCNGRETCASCEADCGSCMITGVVTDPCPVGVMQGPNRECGWRTGVSFACSPTRATMVGCTDGSGAGSLCQPSYGACVGDPVIRVCPGTEPCTAAQALEARSGSFDDQCSSCPSAYVTCPPSGQILVLTGDFDSNNPVQRGTCTPAVR